MIVKCLVNNITWAERGKLYRVEEAIANRFGWYVYYFSRLDDDDNSKFMMVYGLNDKFYRDWQPMEEVCDMKDWRYIPNWPEKHLTCTFCGTDKSVKYAVVVKDVNGEDCHVPACNKCVFRMTIDGK